MGTTRRYRLGLPRPAAHRSPHGRRRRHRSARPGHADVAGECRPATAARPRRTRAHRRHCRYAARRKCTSSRAVDGDEYRNEYFSHCQAGNARLGWSSSTTDGSKRRLMAIDTVAPTGTGGLTDDMLARFHERAPIYDRENRFFDEDFEELRRAGYLTIAVPKDL